MVIQWKACAAKAGTSLPHPSAPEMDFVITVCDKAAGEMCPLWPGQPVTAHWGFPDPAAVVGTDEEKRAAFAQTLHQMRNRVQLFLSLPLETLDRMAIENKMRAIGKATAITAALPQRRNEMQTALNFAALFRAALQSCRSSTAF